MTNRAWVILSLFVFLACRQPQSTLAVHTSELQETKSLAHKIPEVIELSRRTYFMNIDTIAKYREFMKPVSRKIGLQLLNALEVSQGDILAFRKFPLNDSELLVSINRGKYNHSKSYLSLIKDSTLLDFVEITDSFNDVYDFKTVHSSLNQNENTVRLLIYKRGWIDDFDAGNTGGEYKVYQDSIYHYEIDENKINLIRSESGI